MERERERERERYRERERERERGREGEREREREREIEEREREREEIFFVRSEWRRFGVEPKACACSWRHSETIGTHRNKTKWAEWSKILTVYLSMINKNEGAIITTLYKGMHGYLPLLIISATNNDNTSYQWVACHISNSVPSNTIAMTRTLQHHSNVLKKHLEPFSFIISGTVKKTENGRCNRIGKVLASPIWALRLNTSNEPEFNTELIKVIEQSLAY